MSGYHKQTLCALALILSLVMPQAMAAPCAAGTLDLELVDVAGVGSALHPIAKCYNSMTVTVTTGCTLSVTANGEDNYVPAIYSADTTYSQVGGCPAGGTITTYTTEEDMTNANNVATLIATSIYATGLTATAAVEAGIVTITSSGATLKFRPSSKTGTSAGIFAAGAPSCSVPTECAAPLVGKMPVCDAGRYPVSIADTTTFVCAFCAAGTTSELGNEDAAEAETCTRCAAGTAAPVVGATSCSACDAGTFSTLGSSDCRPCAPGTYQNAGSASSCKSCPTTWSSHTYGATGCIKCTNGRPALCTADCSDATAGSAGAFTALMDGGSLFGASGDTLNSYSYPALLKTCSPISTLVAFAVDETCAIEIHALAVTTPTDNGKACSDPSNVESAVMAYYTDAATIMTLVPDNVAVSNIVKIVYTTASTVTMSVIAVARDPISLPASVSGDLTVNGGALVGTTVTTTCPAGTYLQGSEDTLTCPACDPGFYCPALATSPTECTPGTYSTMGQDTCTAADTDCPVGQQFNPETNGCECAPGWRKTSTDPAALVCAECEANTISAGGTQATCTACDGATPYSAPGSETCGVCPAGEALVNSVCTRCAAGQEPDGEATPACKACDAGYYNPGGVGGSEFDTCQKCAGGTAVNGEKTACVTCDVGTASPNGVACDTCPAGGYAPAGANRCTPCAGGSEQNTAKTGCTKCAAGTHREGFSSAGCVACDDGSAARIGSDTCTRCMPGTYATGQVAECIACPVNTYAVDYGTTVCAACPSGTSTLGETGATECSRCPAGTKLVGDTCVDCPLGEFQNRAGQRTCKKCPIGKFSDVLGSETCELCPGGRYNSITGSSTCRACPSGTFSPGGKGSCSICPRGRYSAPGATACTTCTAGYYANKLGSRSCTACPAGSRCPGRGSTGPTLCAAGSFQSKPAQTTCTPCPKKTFSNKAGASKCAACSSATTVGSKTCARRRMLLGRFDTATL